MAETVATDRLVVRAPDPGDDADLDALVRLVAELHSDLGLSSRAFDRVAARAALSATPPRLLGALAWLEGAPVGAVLWHPSYDTEHAAFGAYVTDLVTTVAARRRGVARALLAHAAARMRASGGVFLWWASLPDNARAHGLYAMVESFHEPMRAHVAAYEAFARLADEGEAA